MNWDAIGAIGEILGAISVLVTLVYLAQQIRQSNRIATASSEISIRDNFSSINTAIYGDEEIAQLLVNSEDANYQFSKVEHMRLRVLLTQLVNVWLSIEAAYDNGMASKASFNNIFDDVTQVTTGWPATKPIFLEIVKAFPSHDKTELFQALRNI
jgi:hypothetical protein